MIWTKCNKIRRIIRPAVAPRNDVVDLDDFIKSANSATISVAFFSQSSPCVFGFGRKPAQFLPQFFVVRFAPASYGTIGRFLAYFTGQSRKYISAILTRCRDSSICWMTCSGPVSSKLVAASGAAKFGAGDGGVMLGSLKRLCAICACYGDMGPPVPLVVAADESAAFLNGRPTTAFA